jgi:hypothetical protein
VEKSLQLTSEMSAFASTPQGNVPMPSGFTTQPPMMMMQSVQYPMPTQGPPELPGDKLSPAECQMYGVPLGAVWGRVEGAADQTVDDDVRGTQV